MRTDLPLRIRVESGFYVFLAVLLLMVPIRWILAAFTAAVIHELGHYLAVRLLGGQVVSGTIGSRGARMVTLPMPPGKEMAAVLAGPAASLLLLGLYRCLPRVAICGLIQGVYNLIPIGPLDGGKAVRCLISLLTGNDRGLFSTGHGKKPCKEGKQRVQ